VTPTRQPAAATRHALGRRPLQRRGRLAAPLLVSLALHGLGGWLWVADLASLRSALTGTRAGEQAPALELELERPWPASRPPTPRRPLLEPVVFSEPSLPEPPLQPLPDPAVPAAADRDEPFDTPRPALVHGRRPAPAAATLDEASTAPVAAALAASTPAPEPAADAPSGDAPTDTPATTPAASPGAVAGGPPSATSAQPSRDNRPPRYPGLARRRGWQGRVVLAVQVDATGRALAVAVAESSGHGVLDDAAAAAVADWRFEPATEDGLPVAGEAEVSVRFSLTDG